MEPASDMEVTLFSFGFKHAPVEADTVIDVRFLPNPYYVAKLSDGTGLDQNVSSYVLDNSIAEKFFNIFEPFLLSYIQTHADTDRKTFLLSVGCTGGKHRSVAVAEKIKMILADHGVTVDLFHRDIQKA